MRRLVGVLCALALSACAFSSEAPLFSARDAATPIRDGAQFAWIEDGVRDSRAVRFTRSGKLYTIYRVGERVGETDERPMRALFVPIRDTRETDYLVQITLDEDAIAYAFLWRRGDGYRLITSLAAFGDKAPDTAGLCTPKQYGECAFATREALMRFYEALVLPEFVRGEATPKALLELMPENRAARR